MLDNSKPDLDAARHHLELLTGHPYATVCWQVFDDNKQRGDRRLARSFHGILDDVLSKLRAAHAHGAGVYVSVNETDGTGRKRENMRHARAVFLDLDGAPLPDSWPVIPDLVVHSSSVNGVDKYQTWWFIEPTDDFDSWQRMQRALALRYGGDLKCCIVTQVGRCAGFYHQKDPSQPWRVHIIADNAVDPLVRYDLDDLVKRFGFDLSAVTIPASHRDRIERPPPIHGWDHDLDIVVARRLLADEDAWKRTSDGAVSIYRMACRVRDLGISQALAVEMIEEYAPALPAQADGDVRHVARKVEHAYRYAQGHAGARSIEADRREMIATLDEVEPEDEVIEDPDAGVELVPADEVQDDDELGEVDETEHYGDVEDDE